MQQNSTRTTILREDYQPYPFQIKKVDLRIELDPVSTRVTAVMSIERRLGSGDGEPLILAGQGLKLERVVVDGLTLMEADYLLDAQRLVIGDLPQAFRLETEVLVDPQGNTALEGLYMSNGMYCTQCEAEGFRKITFYPDRPDVLAPFTTTVVGCPKRQPVLLANGNRVARGLLEDGRHYVTWEDPYPKPSYLFALVAGELTCIEDRFTTRSGREVLLHFFVEERNAGKCAHAIASLQQAMRWDEERFGLEYDLDIYMVVAVDDFNMGAMENKGLNVFNSKYVLACPDTATDSDYQAIQGVIGHEYFHNWTGNRVTCRDWFQLSLKEGLTVYRDQEFSADMTSRPVKRIEEVRVLRAAQFPEDAGPLAHPVRPDSYVEINNFYTTTVYNKGAEVVRMQATLLGREGFRKGMDLYFARHDGQAVTVDDFVAAMADANDVDLTQFMRWYSQSGTPVVKGEGAYDPLEKTYTLTLRQSCPPTPGQRQKEPFHIPVVMGLIGPSGEELPLRIDGEEAATETSRTLCLQAAEQRFRFVGVEVEPVPSLLRDFSAPVILNYPYSREQRAHLMGHDSDQFNRWEASQQLACELLLEKLTEQHTGQPLEPLYLEGCRQLLRDPDTDAALRALALTLPGETYLAEQRRVSDPVEIRRVREAARRQLAEVLEDDWIEAYEGTRQKGAYSLEPLAVGARALRNLALNYLVTLEKEEHLQRCLSHYHQADNMTDCMAALGALVNSGSKARYEVLEAFERRWRNDPLVMDKWFSVQATATGGDVLDNVVRLMGHAAFSLRNPNKVRSLIGSFAHANPAGFHREDGAGYRFVAAQVLELDRLNPQVAARLVSAFTRWRRYDEHRQALMRHELERILAAKALSEDVYEIVSKSLNG